ncbi:MAG: deoxyribonuclease IV [Mycoplasmataceae bacterium]|nr:deoxyribonuclease IV [Mycoplasmataceae bacterium]
MKKPLLGAHVSFLKDTQLLGTIEMLKEINATSGAMYISNSRGYKKTFEIDDKQTELAFALAKDINIDPRNIIVHAPMVGNLANIEFEKQTWILTVESYIKDLQKMHQVGLKYYNFHPGSAKDQELGIKQCAKGINKILAATATHKTVLLIETMMTKGNFIGKNFAQIKEIISLVKDQTRIGVCLDTCHVWDGGYDIKTDLEGVLNSFDKEIGLKNLKAMHINDSKNVLGSGKDRHELIGQGYIGLDALKAIVNHEQLRMLPKALETPYGKDDYRKWSLEIEMLLE